MEEITHRQLRNDSAAVLRRVAAGETILVTNSGKPAAVIGPPPGDVISVLAAQGLLRGAVAPPSRLTHIKRRASTTTAAQLVDDVRGRW